MNRGRQWRSRSVIEGIYVCSVCQKGHKGFDVIHMHGNVERNDTSKLVEFARVVAYVVVRLNTLIKYVMY